ncbi:MAG: RHS repeat-associated core domain-containing protein, partial [Bacteroidales bacterium]|nr:RHS repeat-associated core domain-containing protein [Bacteroidales bacterium]
ELQERFGVNLYDSQARFQSNTGAFLSIDPMAEKYYSISPYSYCAANPVNLVDPEGEDGMVTGEGTKDNPYIITAVYYYKAGEDGLDEEYIRALKSAIDKYNKSGLIKEKKDGKTIYFKYNLSVAASSNPEYDRLKNTGFKTTTGEPRYYGNVVGAEQLDQGEEFGSANNIRIDFNKNNIEKGVNMGLNRFKLLEGTAIHEIGHNLGAEHSDGTQTMQENLSITQSANGEIYADYPKVTSKHLKIIFGRMNSKKENRHQGRVWLRN